MRGSSRKLATSMPVEGANNIGYVTNQPELAGICRRRRALVELPQPHPGINAVSGFHDAMLVRMELDGLSRLGVSIINFPTMPPAAALTYGALLPGVPTEAINHR